MRGANTFTESLCTMRKSADTGPGMFEDEVRQLAAEMNQVQRKVIHSLTPIQQVVLRVKIETE